jgi:Fe-S cluster assembly protein SufD
VATLTRETFDLLDAPFPDDIRREAIADFENLPAPSSKDEAWRYVEVEGDLGGLALPVISADPLAADEFVNAFDPVGRALVVDGRVAGVSGRHVAGTPRLLGLVASDLDRFAAAHLAFATGGASVDVPAGTVMEGPALLEVQAVADRAVSFPHLSITVGENAEAAVVIVYRSPDHISATVVPQVEVEVAAGARLRLLTVQSLGLGTTAVIHQRVRLDRDAGFRFGEVGLGGKLARLDLGIRLEGTGSSSETVGLFFGHADQVLDYRMTITHVGPSTTSDVLLKGAVEDRAQSVFSGLLRVEKDAVRASAFETNRNLVLSPEAKAHSVPNLEILCDDVMCGHGSSVGPLDDEHLYYLQSRGLRRARAERLLVKGFFRQVVDRLPIPGIDGPLLEVLDARFAEGQSV